LQRIGKCLSFDTTNDMNGGNSLAILTVRTNEEAWSCVEGNHRFGVTTTPTIRLHVN
jgi:hypothetical protein